MDLDDILLRLMRGGENCPVYTSLSLSVSVFLSPRERLFYVAEAALSLVFATGIPHVVGQGARAADGDDHGADLVFDLLLDQERDVWPTRKHLDGAGGRGDLLRVLRACVIESYLQLLLSSGHAEDII